MQITFEALFRVEDPIAPVDIVQVPEMIAPPPEVNAPAPEVIAPAPEVAKLLRDLMWED